MTSNARPALIVGLGAALLIAGALWFQYFDNLPPCEICMWQRYPHVVAGVVGIAGFLLVRRKLLPGAAGPFIALLAVAAVAVSGAIGVYHAGIEWHWWPGPQSCTGSAFHTSGGPLNLNSPVVMCDNAAWRLFGISLAGYNAIFSFALAGLGIALVRRTGRNP